MAKEQPANRSQRTRRLASIQSLVLLILLAVTVGVTVVTGVLGYRNGTESLRDAAFAQVVEVRTSRASEIERLYQDIENQISVSAQNGAVIEATVAFGKAFVELDAKPVDPAKVTEVANWYRQVWEPQLLAATASSSGSPRDASAYVPTSNAAITLQALYSVPPTGFDDAIKVEDAGDGSTWSAVHRQAHPYFRAMVQQLGYEDVLLVDRDGNIVYSAYKGVDLGSNLFEGPLRLSNLATAARETMRQAISGVVRFTDFEDYSPSLGTPAGWAVTLIRDSTGPVGIMAVELPISRIDDVMTGGKNWQESGLGRTGQAYLVGADRLMRSTARPLVEDPTAYRNAAVAAGLPPSDADRVVASNTTLLIQPVPTVAVDRALAGERGTIVGPGFFGQQTIAAFAPLTVEGLHWVIVAEIAESEAFAPVTEFTSGIVIYSAIIVLIVSVLSLLIARVLVRPLRRLGEAANRIAAGETGVQVNVGVSDELADLAVAFNEMSRSLQVKAELIESQREENQRLVRSLMPESIADRYRKGVTDVVEDHQEVTVLYADIVGFDDVADTLSSPQALGAFNEILKALDDVADRLGLEHVRTTRAGYLASCGLVVPRVDNARRSVDFALEAQNVLDRFGDRYGRTLGLRVGIDTGTVTSGLVGRSHVAYDLWGDAVSIAFRVQGGATSAGIFVTERVVTRLPAGYQFDEVGNLAGASGTQRIWRVRRETAEQQ